MLRIGHLGKRRDDKSLTDRSGSTLHWRIHDLCIEKTYIIPTLQLYISSVIRSLSFIVRTYWQT
jgi:hypothetical protein